ncbi:DUF3332 domain-containing protein [Hallella colorans]|uniref:DUF3332 domain-containing protein n=1 Tax=Hallella colorans TaxID=1703337 RepID=UPI0023F58BA2|nr:DUF3332 domain-containing protein [Hallella colorans]
MKTKHLTLATCLMAGIFFTTSCVGTFSMFNKLASWNRNATDNKFLNEIIFIVISPAYAIAGMADMLILNTIEFWTGDNPMAMKVGTVKQVMGQDGKYYAVTYKADGYDIKLPTGETISFVYDKKTDAWSQIQKGKKTEIFRFNSDGTIQANLPDGTKLNVTPDEAGLYQVRMAMNDGRFFAAR